MWTTRSSFFVRYPKRCHQRAHLHHHSHIFLTSGSLEVDFNPPRSLIIDFLISDFATSSRPSLIYTEHPLLSALATPSSSHLFASGLGTFASLIATPSTPSLVLGFNFTVVFLSPPDAGGFLCGRLLQQSPPRANNLASL